MVASWWFPDGLLVRLIWSEEWRRVEGENEDGKASARNPILEFRIIS